MRKKLTLEYVRQVFKDNNCVLLAIKYVNSQTKMPYICNCGRRSEINYANFNSGGRCNQCAIEKRAAKRRLNISEVRYEFESRGFTLLSETYKNNVTPLDCICSCGNTTKMSLSHLKEEKTCRKCYIERISGSNARQFIKDRPDEYRRRKRHDSDHKVWRLKVFERDDFICFICHKRGGNLNAHHINAYNKYVDWRYEVANGVTLCQECHKNFHSKFGYGDNTFTQLMDWQLKTYKENLALSNSGSKV